jgi:energy-coupling factor transporter ATP-binding protein EcfA2
MTGRGVAFTAPIARSGDVTGAVFDDTCGNLIGLFQAWTPSAPSCERGERAFRERIGIVLQFAGVDRELTVHELVTLFGSYYPHPRDAAEVIDLVGLGDKRTARTRTLSGGQQRRLDLALGIVGDPDLLFLDEPTTGFDPSARHRSWELVESLRELGKTILLTTHYMDEAQNLADRVAIMAAGRIVAQGSPESLGGRDVAEAEVSFRLPPGVALADLPGELRDGLRRHETASCCAPARPPGTCTSSPAGPWPGARSWRRWP